MSLISMLIRELEGSDKKFEVVNEIVSQLRSKASGTQGRIATLIDGTIDHHFSPETQKERIKGDIDKMHNLLRDLEGMVDGLTDETQTKRYVCLQDGCTRNSLSANYLCSHCLNDC